MMVIFCEYHGDLIRCSTNGLTKLPTPQVCERLLVLFLIYFVSTVHNVQAQDSGLSEQDSDGSYLP